MDEWFSILAASCALSPGAVRDLDELGFVVIAGLVATERLALFAKAYDFAVSCAAADEVSIGSSTTRVDDFVNRGAEFDGLYVYPLLLEACCRIIGQPFKLSTMHARTLRPRSQTQNLHVDFKWDVEGWPMVGFIVMVDEFRSDNGATRFVPGSHKWLTNPNDVMNDPKADHESQVLACGSPGSVIIYNGSIWHGHSANKSDEARRSIQGAYIRRSAEGTVNHAACTRPETFSRISPLAKYLLVV